MKSAKFISIIYFGLTLIPLNGWSHGVVLPVPYDDTVIEHQDLHPEKHIHTPGEELDIIEEGHPTLRLIAEPVTEEELHTDEFQKFLDDMAYTMDKARGVGLAAPQVNVSKRMFVMGGVIGLPLAHVINPEINFYKNKGMKDSGEGCLSIPGKFFYVPRYKSLHIDYTNRHGDRISEDVKGFKAIVIQHEYDHLDGILISDFLNEFVPLSEEIVPQM